MKTALTLFFFPILALANQTQEEIRKEAEDIGLSFQAAIEAVFSDEKSPIEILLQGRQPFVAPDIDFLEKIAPCPFEAEIREALEKSQTFDEIDPDETFLVSPDPSTSLEIKQALEAQPTLAADQYETCQESFSKRYHIQKNKETTQVEAVTQTELSCNGHSYSTKEDPDTDEDLYWRTDAEKLKEKWTSELEQGKKTGQIKKYNVTICDGKWNSNYKVRKEWWHKDGEKCSNNHTTTVVVSPAKTVTTWETPDAMLLDWLSQAPHCKLIATTFPDPSKKSLIYECGSGEDPKCHHIRLRGGQIFEKTCLETDPDGECIVYEKTYRFPQKAPAPSFDAQIDGEDIWGLSELSQNTIEDPDFGDAISKLSAVSQMEGAEGDGTPLEAEIFPGKVLRCRTSWLGRMVHDCCGVPCKGKKELGVAVATGLVDCSQEEDKLFEARKMDKCIPVGKRWIKLGLLSERTYVCFPSVLSKIIQEQGRAQLGLDFGDVETPKPEGFSISELQRLRFDEMNFEDFIKTLDIPFDTERLSQKLKEKTAEFDMNQSKNTTETLLKGQASQCTN
ncbi:MAG: conjugal transfer protein TraN [Chlamydiota bacterium]